MFLMLVGMFLMVIGALIIGLLFMGLNRLERIDGCNVVGAIFIAGGAMVTAIVNNKST
jgi:hypothetical protein